MYNLNCSLTYVIGARMQQYSSELHPLPLPHQATVTLGLPKCEMTIWSSMGELHLRAVDALQLPCSYP